MSAQRPSVSQLSEEPRSEFELQTQEVLEQSTARLDARVRSRLNQARQAALEAHAAQGRSPLQRWFESRGLFAPVGAVAAAAVLALVLWTARTPGPPPFAALPFAAISDEGAGPVEDLDLLADRDVFALASEADLEFYEWALAESAGATTDDGLAES